MTGAIVCGVDDSESARGAARVARALSGGLGRDLIFVRAVRRDAPAAGVDAAAGRFERLSDGADGGDCGATWLVDLGDPVDALVAAAWKAQASLIVVGSTGARSPLRGSVAADVSRRAPCPVVVVPAGAAAAVDGRAGRPTVDDRKPFAGGLARFGLGDGGTDFAGGIARFGLGRGEPG